MTGLIQIYTGNGKGKTTAAFGLAMRASGRGLKVMIIQFMKQGNAYGEYFTAEKIDNIEIKSFGRSTFVSYENPDKIDVDLAVQGLEFAKMVLAGAQYDLVILDEVLVALMFKLIPLNSLIELLKNKHEKVEVVLTGRGAPKTIIDMADLVSEIGEIKHPYTQGIHSRKGIDL